MKLSTFNVHKQEYIDPIISDIVTYTVKNFPEIHFYKTAEFVNLHSSLNALE